MTWEAKIKEINSPLIDIEYFEDGVSRAIKTYDIRPMTNVEIENVARTEIGKFQLQGTTYKSGQTIILSVGQALTTEDAAYFTFKQARNVYEQFLKGVAEGVMEANDPRIQTALDTKLAAWDDSMLDRL